MTGGGTHTQLPAVGGHGSLCLLVPTRHGTPNLEEVFTGVTRFLFSTPTVFIVGYKEDTRNEDRGLTPRVLNLVPSRALSRFPGRVVGRRVET